MNSADKLGMIVAVTVVVIFVSIIAGGASLEKTVSEDIQSVETFIPKEKQSVKNIEQNTLDEKIQSFNPDKINAKIVLDGTGDVGIITWPIYGGDVWIYEQVEAKSLDGILGKNPTFIVQKNLEYTVEITNNNSHPHAFIIPELNVESKLLNPGDKTNITILSQKEGTYNYYVKDEPILPLGKIKIISVEPDAKREIEKINQKITKVPKLTPVKVKELTDKLVAEEKKTSETLQKLETTTKELVASKSTPRLVSIPLGSSVPGCEDVNGCYIPSRLVIFSGNEVIWKNNDFVTHTVTSGGLEYGATGMFDSGLLNAGDTYSFRFDSSGEYSYYCIIHPWMIGTVTVN